VSTQQQSGLIRFEPASLELIHWIAIVLASVTGLIHIYLYTTQGFLPFLLAGLGFFGAIGLIMILPTYRKWLYAAGVPYTLAQIIGWYTFEQPASFGDISTLALVDKTVQIVLILLLVQLFLGADQTNIDAR